MQPSVTVLREEADERLMQRLQADEAVAFELLYDRYSLQAYRVAYSVCRDRSFAEEAVQEGFLAIWRGRSSYRPLPERSFRAWAMQTVRNRAIDSVRRAAAAKRPRSGDLEVADLADPASRSPLDEVVWRSEHESLRGSLQRLPDAQAEVIGLAFFGELSHTEIAAQLDLPEGTVKGRMRLGLERMRRRMDGDGR